MESVVFCFTAPSLPPLQETTKNCPTCGMGISKTEGCNKMTCAYCGTFFCYKCNAVIRGYDHFGQGGECELFSQEEVRGTAHSHWLKSRVTA